MQKAGFAAGFLLDGKFVEPIKRFGREGKGIRT